uniref:EST1-like DNA-binding domain-containing protein n=1 Tax=Parascaris univalens TaxID=6257 RepID=A0A915BGL7_PARUN
MATEVHQQEEPSTSNADKMRAMNRLPLMCNDVEKTIKELSVKDIKSTQLDTMRSKVRRCLEEVIDDEEYGQTALEHVWHSCYYSLICHIRTSISGWGVEQKERCSREISVLTVELAQLASLHKKRSALISVYMGDLRRYAFMLFSSDRERRLAILHYREAVATDGHSGLALNQLGLMKQDTKMTTALLYFMLAHLAERPFHGAFGNILALLTRATSQHRKGRLLLLLMHCFTSSRIIDFNEYRTKWIDQIDTELDSHQGAHVAFNVHLLSLASACLATKDCEEQSRAVSTMLLDATGRLLRGIEELVASESAKLLKKGERRRRASDSNESVHTDPEEARNSKNKLNNDGEVTDYWVAGYRMVREQNRLNGIEQDDDVVELSEDESSELVDSSVPPSDEIREAKTLLVALLHFTIVTVKQLYGEHTPTSIRFEFEQFAQRISDTLNSFMLGDRATRAELNFYRPEQVDLPIWYVTTEDAMLLLPTLVRRLIDTPEVPILFDEFFRFVPIASNKDMVMKNMAKLRLACRAKQEEARALLPVYVIPEDNVVLDHLPVLRDLVNDGQLRVVIAEDTLRMMDKIKKGDIRAREGIRWLQQGICEQGDRLEMRKADSVLLCAEDVAWKVQTTKKSLATKPVTVTILTTDILGEQYDEKPLMVGAKISRENVDQFQTRYKAALKEY